MVYVQEVRRGCADPLCVLLIVILTCDSANDVSYEEMRPPW